MAFTPINRWDGGASQVKSLIPDLPADPASSLRVPPQWEAEALKLRASNRRRHRNPRTNPMLRAEVLAAGRTEPPSREQTVVDQPLLFTDTFTEATFVPRKMKRANSPGSRGTSPDNRNTTIKAVKNTAFQRGVRLQPLTDSQPFTRFDSSKETRYSLEESLNKGKSKPVNDCSGERTAPSDFSGRLPMVSSNMKFGLSPETLRRLDTFRYMAPSTHDQPIVAGSFDSYERKAKLRGEDVTNAILASSLVEGDHVVLMPGIIQCRHNDTQARAEAVAANAAPEEDFGWDQCMDDALLDQLDHIEAIPNYGLHGESTGTYIGPERNRQSSRQAVGNSNSTGSCGETGIGGVVGNEDLTALLINHHELGHSHKKSESTKELGGHPQAYNPESSFRALSEIHSPEYDCLSLGEIGDDDKENSSFGMGVVNGMMQLSGATERFSPPSSLQYPFDDSSQTLEVYDSNLICSALHTGETPGSDNAPFTDGTQYEASISSADIPFSGHSDQIMDQTAEVTDRVPEPADLNAPSLLTDAVDGSTENRKIRVRIPKPFEATGLSTPPINKLPPHLLEFDVSGPPKPFVRPAFPERVQDRSPVVGLSSKTFLRTCFRVGEALRAGSHASRWGQDAVIELYARVVFSSRDGWKQHFQFADLFHDRPPFLSGTYEIFHAADLWERDSARFLTEEGKGKMCRCLGRMKRAGPNWKLVMLNIWEATWDDVAWVKGIICA